MAELKPCPFCGANNAWYAWEYEICYVKCKACGARASRHLSINDAKEAWNRRAEDGK